MTVKFGRNTEGVQIFMICEHLASETNRSTLVTSFPHR
jgi:hypothetical protein